MFGKEEGMVRLDEFFELANVIVCGHFVFTSGRHSDTYFDKRLLYRDEKTTSHVCRQIALFADDAVEVVVGPEEAGFTVAKFVAEHLGILLSRKIKKVPAKKNGSGFELSRHYRRFIAGKQVLVVDDVLTTGGTIQKVVELVRRHGGNVRGVGVICNRGGMTEAKLRVPWLYAAITLSLRSYAPEDCPLCKAGISIDPKPSG